MDKTNETPWTSEQQSITDSASYLSQIADAAQSFQERASRHCRSLEERGRELTRQLISEIVESGIGSRAAAEGEHRVEQARRSAKSLLVDLATAHEELEHRFQMIFGKVAWLDEESAAKETA